MFTYIITGAYGHLGSTITKALLAKNQDVRCLVMQNEQPPKGMSYFGAKIFVGDVTVKSSLDEIFSGDSQKIVIHTAGIVSIENKVSNRLYQTNVIGTENIIEKCKETGSRLVHVSSVHTIPEPPKGELIKEINSFDPSRVKGGYAKTKAIATQKVLDAARDGLDACVVMPSGILGPYDDGKNHLVAMIKDFLCGKLRAIVKGGYDMVDVRDVADGCIAAAEKGKKGETYILSNSYSSVSQVINFVSGITEVKPIKVVLPLWFAYMFSPLCEAYYKSRHVRPLYTAYSLSVLKSNGHIDHTKAKNELGYKTRSLTTTIADTVAWLMSNAKINTPKRLKKANAKI